MGGNQVTERGRLGQTGGSALEHYVQQCGQQWLVGVAPSQSTVVHSRVIGQSRWARKRNAALESAMLQRQTGEVWVSQSQS
jgi:hypothetical protein